VIARNTTDPGSAVIACNQTGGTIRNSVCQTTGSGAVAVGSSIFAGGVININLRGVTATSTGSNSFGIQYFFATAGAPAPTVTVSAKSVIAQGGLVDVRARAVTAPSSVTINLDHSAFDTSDIAVSGGATASVTPPGEGAPNFNETDPPLLAADGYHQLAGSPTINAGQTDASSGTTDIDGQARQIGLLPPDIGADERGVDTTTAVSCVPASVMSGSATTCTGTVSAAAEFISGTIAFGSSAAGAFSPAPSCMVSGLFPQEECSVTFTPSAAGTHSITATYGGGPSHEGSQGATDLTATQPPAGPAGPGTTPAPGTTPQTKCKKKKRKKAGAAAKCKRKKKKKK
jgi:hypothetical protein